MQFTEIFFEKEKVNKSFPQLNLLDIFSLNSITFHSNLGNFQEIWSSFGNLLIYKISNFNITLITKNVLNMLILVFWASRSKLYILSCYRSKKQNIQLLHFAESWRINNFCFNINLHYQLSLRTASIDCIKSVIMKNLKFGNNSAKIFPRWHHYRFYQ